MDEQIICLDSPTDFMVGKYVSADELKHLMNVPCKIKAGVFILCMEGYVCSTINLAEYKTTKSNIITLTPNSYIQVHEMSDDILIYFAAFSSDFMSYANFLRSTMSCLSIIYRHPVIPISQKISNLIASFYELFYQYAVYPNISNNKEMIKAIFTMCSQGIIELYDSNHFLEKQELNRYTEIYQDFINLALQYYTTERNVTFYADRLGLTLSYFSTCIKKAIGQTPLEVLTQIIIIDAKVQLKGTNQEIKNIAMELGFTNLSFFNKFFRHHVGITPQEYRGKLYTYSNYQKDID